MQEYLTSVAFVAHVRTSDGIIWRFNSEELATQINKVQLETTKGAFDPSSE